jgi:hypothetical protein
MYCSVLFFPLYIFLAPMELVDMAESISFMP